MSCNMDPLVQRVRVRMFSYSGSVFISLFRLLKISIKGLWLKMNVLEFQEPLEIYKTPRGSLAVPLIIVRLRHRLEESENPVIVY